MMMEMDYGGLGNILSIYFSNMSKCLRKDIKIILELSEWIWEIKSEKLMGSILHGEMEILKQTGNEQLRSQHK